MSPWILISIAALTLPASYARGCTTISLQFTLHETATLMNLDGTIVTDSSGNPVTVASAVVGDGNDVYSANGSVTPCTGGTNDAVLNVQTGKRKITVKLPAPIPGSGANAQTPPVGTYTDNGVLNVRNIVCSGCGNPGQPFVTKGGVQLNGMFNGSQYNLHYLPTLNISTTLPFAPDYDNDGNAANYPNPTSLVLVIPQPYSCAQGIYPSWIVRSTLQNQTIQPGYLQVATLVDFGNGPKNFTSVGQFSVPFEYRIQAESCFTPY